MIWIPCKLAQPDRDGTYIVTTSGGKVRFDRYVDGEWAMCHPQCRGAYKPHRAWAYVPKPANFERNRW